MSGTDKDSGRKEADGHRRPVKAARWRPIVKGGLLVAGLFLVVLAAVLLAVCFREVRSPSGVSVVVQDLVWELKSFLGLGVREIGGHSWCCSTNIYGLAKAMVVYAHDSESGGLLPADQWCDLLVSLDYTPPKQFVCKNSDAVEGESSYAINVNAAGENLSGLPGDMVLLFETDFGKDPNGRQAFLKERAWYPALYGSESSSGGQIKVHKDRWNQVGGPEILTADRNHYEVGKGCYVAFIDTHVEYVKKKDLSQLKWTADANDK